MKFIVLHGAVNNEVVDVNADAVEFMGDASQIEGLVSRHPAAKTSLCFASGNLVVTESVEEIKALIAAA